MERIQALIAAIENVSDDKIIEAVSFAIKTESITHGIIGVLFVGILVYILYEIVKEIVIGK